MDTTVESIDVVRHRFDTLPSWDALMEWYTSLFEKQEIVLDAFNHQIEMLFFQEVSDNFELELREELVAATTATHTPASFMRIPVIVLCRTLEDNENRHVLRHGKQRRSAWNSLLVKLHEVLDPLFWDGLVTASRVAMADNLIDTDLRLDALLHRCEETLERKTRATMDFDSRMARIRKDMRMACSCAVYLATTQSCCEDVDITLHEAHGRLQVAASLIDSSPWKRHLDEKQDLLDRLSESESRYSAMQELEISAAESAWSDESDGEHLLDPQIESCAIPADKLRELEDLSSHDGQQIFPHLEFYLAWMGYDTKANDSVLYA